MYHLLVLYITNYNYMLYFAYLIAWINYKFYFLYIYKINIYESKFIFLKFMYFKPRFIQKSVIACMLPVISLIVFLKQIMFLCYIQVWGWIPKWKIQWIWCVHSIWWDEVWGRVQKWSNMWIWWENMYIYLWKAVLLQKS